MKKRSLIIDLFFGTIMLAGSLHAVEGSITFKQNDIQQEIIKRYTEKTKKSFGTSRNIKQLQHAWKNVARSTVNELARARGQFPKLPVEKMLRDAENYINNAYEKKAEAIQGFKPIRKLTPPWEKK